MEFEWHEEKREANVQKHGVDFKDAISVFKGLHFVEDRTRPEDGEIRKGAIGPIPSDLTPDHWSGNLIVVVFTRQNESIRIISARRASTDERRRYEHHLGGR